MADVEGYALRFQALARIFSGRRLFSPLGEIFGGRFPVWIGEEGRPIPIDATEMFWDSLAAGGGIDYPIYQAKEFRDWIEGKVPEAIPRGEITTASIDSAVEGFREGLIEFLNVRLELSDNEGPECGGSTPLRAGPRNGLTKRTGRSLSAMDEAEKAVDEPAVSQRAHSQKSVRRSLGAAALSAAGTSNSPYLPFTVHADNAGIDVEQAPAYFLSWVFFGGPTTPADGWILPGLYRFRGRNHNGKYRTDPTKFKIPPSEFAVTIL